MDAYLRLTITDASGVLVDRGHPCNPLARVTRTFWYRLPACWVRDGRLIPDRRRQLLAELYGPECRHGGSRSAHYVILELSEELLTEAQVADRPWLSDRAVFYAWREGDRFVETDPALL